MVGVLAAVAQHLQLRHRFDVLENELHYICADIDQAKPLSTVDGE
jgi:hypothetical protein